MLKSKRETTRFQILVEIAANQPSVRQQEIATKMGVTPQAVSEYIREMVDDGFVNSDGRGRYNVTKTGVEWVTNTAETLEAYLKYVTSDVIKEVVVWTALAKEPLAKGDVVGVFMRGGLLYASKTEQPSMGEVTNDAEPGEDVGVSKLSGIIALEEGTIRICKVPRIQRGGSRSVSPDRILDALEGIDYIGAVGIEAKVLLKNAGLTEDAFFGAREGVVEAAFHGINSAMVIVDEEFTGFLKRLESAGLSYEICDLSLI
ncbi:MAG: MarR family transcriptional regulator [Methanogenium sp.]